MELQGGKTMSRNKSRVVSIDRQKLQDLQDDSGFLDLLFEYGLESWKYFETAFDEFEAREEIQ